MSWGEAFSILVNIGVGLYFVWLYPATVRKKLGQGRLPPLFERLVAILPPLGYMLIGGTLTYLALRVSSLL